MKHGVTIKGRSVVVDRSEPAGKTESRRKEAGGKKKPRREKASKSSREERGYDAPRGKKFEKADWMQFLHPEEGWARRRPKKK